MTDLRAAAQQALEALESLQGGCTDSDDGTVEAITVWCPEVIDALLAALAEPVQEPVAQRKPLTDEEIADIVVEMNGNEPTALFWRDLARAIERAHSIGGKA